MRRRVSAIGPNRSTAWPAITARSTGSTSGGRFEASNRASQRRSSSIRRIRLRLVVDTLERGPVPGHVPLAGEGEARLGLDDRERRPQLVRRVGGEVELAAARRLDRRRDPPADRDARRGTPPRGGTARSAAPRGSTFWRVSLTASSDWPITTQSSPTAWPASRRSTPLIVAVIGPRTPVYSAGRAGFVLSVWTWPSESTAQTTTGAPPNRSGGGASYGWSSLAVVVVEPDERRRDPLVDLVGEVALDDRDRRATQTARYATATTAVARRATRIETRRTLGSAAAATVTPPRAGSRRRGP